MKDGAWIYEFIYRGHHPDADARPAWAVTYKVKDDDPGDQYSMEALEAMGIELPKVFEELHRQVLIDHERMREIVKAARVERDQALETARKIAEEANTLIHSQALAMQALKDNLAAAEAKAVANELHAQPIIQQLQLDVAELKKGLKKS